MPKVSIKQPAQPYEGRDDENAVCEVNACGANAVEYEVTGDTVPLYVCPEHSAAWAKQRDSTWEGSDPRD